MQYITFIILFTWLIFFSYNSRQVNPRYILCDIFGENIF